MNKHDTCGQRMTKRRTELSLSQTDVAARIKFGKPGEQERQLSVVAYAMYERDEIDPSLKAIEEIAGALSVTPGWLAFGT